MFFAWKRNRIISSRISDHFIEDNMLRPVFKIGSLFSLSFPQSLGMTTAVHTREGTTAVHTREGTEKSFIMISMIEKT